MRVAATWAVMVRSSAPSIPIVPIPVLVVPGARQPGPAQELFGIQTTARRKRRLAIDTTLAGPAAASRVLENPHTLYPRAEPKPGPKKLNTRISRMSRAGRSRIGVARAITGLPVRGKPLH